MGEKFVMSFSGGKDSTLALYRMIKRGYEPVGLLVTFKKGKDSSFTHSIKKDLLYKVSKSLDIPLLIVECDMNNYEKEFTKTLLKAKDMGAKICVFGDIDIVDHRKWCEDRCSEANIKCELPLWQEDREALVYEFINEGFETVIKIVNLKYLPIDLLGQTLNKDVVKRIKDLGSDPCGENGEYHTFVVDGPIFKNKIKYIQNENFVDNNYGILDISLV
ncbi:diphthine--ammonia ligase [Romboutsia sp. 1001285H_161024_C4]|uniref:Dph6-related ATP pyrophosphatase n=1 Tax=Romboutsia sp. 1001285H_161024_C4 TaxID=2787109 RepID=UPI00189AFDC4|nr:diphthine--ammonia ligase [Romboutsia sp. 1001285H_161024_C4]